MGRQHQYAVSVEWTGNRGDGTSSYRSYDRDHVVTAENLPDIAGSADPHFRGSPSRWNPEQLLLVAASQCHMMSYLHQAAVNGVVVTRYADHPTAVMTEDAGGGGRFTDITLHPVITVADASMVARAEQLHEPANRCCFIAASLGLPVQHQPTTLVEETVR